MILVYLFHNVVQHPIAGVLWFISQTAEKIKLKRTAKAFDSAGNFVHDCIFDLIEIYEYSAEGQFGLLEKEDLDSNADQH